MVRVGEEAGVLPKVMTDLAELLEHEDEVRSEVVAAVSYPVFVLGFRCFHRGDPADRRAARAFSACSRKC